ncbi:MAG: DUF1266 domain-containing protein [Flavobacterium sp.]|nr:MAG: DUF1266 domain-containing protein [Flavobacterium sp.]
MSPINYNRKYENPTNLSKRQLWLIATSAMLTELNREFHDTLLPYHIFSTSELLEKSKASLLRDWQINNVADFNDTISYLYNEHTFAIMQNNWFSLSEPELNKATQLTTGNTEVRNTLEITRDYKYEKGAYGWHYGRCSWLIRHAFYNEIITEEQAWNLLEDNAKYIKNKFDSWESFALSFMIGAQYWKRNTYNELAIREFKNNVTYLLTSKNSPWSNVNWNDYE